MKNQIDHLQAEGAFSVTKVEESSQ
jgi:hypothetical protein